MEQNNLVLKVKKDSNIAKIFENMKDNTEKIIKQDGKVITFVKKVRKKLDMRINTKVLYIEKPNNVLENNGFSFKMYFVCYED